MKKVVLAGNALTAQVINSYIASDRRYQVIAATVDDDYLQDSQIPGINSIAFSKLREICPSQECVVIMAMGYGDLNRNRESMFRRLKEGGYYIETYVHPDSRIYTEYPLGEGCVVLPGAVIEPYVSVKANSMVWANVTLAHHSRIGEHCWIASGSVISGQAQIGRNCFVGVNATIVNKVLVGDYCFVGGGALITKNTKQSSVHLARSGEEHRFSSEDYVKFSTC